MTDNNLDMNGLTLNEKLMMKNRRYWSELPELPLCMINGRLNLLERVFFGAVCKHWQSASKNCPEIFLVPRSLWLMITKPVYHQGGGLYVCNRDFANFSTSKKFTLEFRGTYLSSRNGWILLNKESTTRNYRKNPIVLLNLLTRSKLEMPCFSPKCYIIRYGTFSTSSRHCNNNVPNCVVLASRNTYGVVLLVAHPGDDEWMEFLYPIQPGLNFSLNSLVMTEERVYCIDIKGDVLVFNLVNRIWTASMPLNRFSIPLPYVVVTTKGDLIKVQGESEESSSKFNFFKLNMAKTAWVALSRKDQLIKGKTWYLHRRNSWVTTTTQGGIDMVYEIIETYSNGWTVSALGVSANDSSPKILQAVEQCYSDGVSVCQVDWVHLG